MERLLASLVAPFLCTLSSFFLRRSMSWQKQYLWLQSLRSVPSPVGVVHSHGPSAVPLLLWQEAHPSHSACPAMSPAMTPATAYPFILICLLTYPLPALSATLFEYVRVRAPGIPDGLQGCSHQCQSQLGPFVTGAAVSPPRHRQDTLQPPAQTLPGVPSTADHTGAVVQHTE